MGEYEKPHATSLITLDEHREFLYCFQNSKKSSICVQNCLCVACVQCCVNPPPCVGLYENMELKKESKKEIK